MPPSRVAAAIAAIKERHGIDLEERNDVEFEYDGSIDRISAEDAGSSEGRDPIMDGVLIEMSVGTFLSLLDDHLKSYSALVYQRERPVGWGACHGG